MDSLLQDVRFGLRMLRRNPAFAVVAVVVLAVGIGANAAIFSLVNSVLLHPLPYPDAERLVVIQDVSPELGPIPMSYPAFLAWREQTDIFEEVGTFINGGEALTGLGEPELIQRLAVSTNLLAMQGVEPVLGRGFRPEEEPRSAAPVVLLTHSFWQNRFHSDRGAIGQKLNLSGQVYTIIGVLPERFNFGNDPVVVTPLRQDEHTAPDGLNFLTVIGKLRPGLTLPQARTAAQVAFARVQQKATHSEGVAVTPLQELVAGRSRPLLLALLGAVAFVLLIAAANVASLLLARAAAREKEIAIRLSLGAGRMRLVRQLLTESTLVSLMGGMLGVGGAWGGLSLLTSLLKRQLPQNIPVHMDPAALGFAALLSLATGILFGLAPAAQSVRSKLQERLKQGSWQTGPSGSQRVRNVLVIAEIALSVVLLAGAGLLLRSFSRLLNVDRGFQTDHVLTMGVWPSPGRYSVPKTEISYLQQIVEQVRTLPGVSAAGLVTTLPLEGGSTNGGITIEGRAEDPKSPLIANKQFVTDGYFPAMRIPLTEGRLFTGADNPDSPKVVIIDQAFARQFFPGQDPIGKHIDVGWGEQGWSQVVGVVANSKLESLDSSGRPTFYALISQKPELLKFLGFALVVRTNVDPASTIQAISRQIHRLDPNQTLARVRTMDEVMALSLAPRRAPMWLFGLFSSTALFLAAIGIYGVLSSYVLQRRQEIGVRMALGAQRRDVLGLIVKQGAKLVGIGLGCGLAAAFFTSRALTSLLFGVKPGDAFTLLGVSLLLALLALLACAVPSLRATQIDPLAVLRNE
jgi:putative ABC transport system permease protein